MNSFFLLPFIVDSYLQTHADGGDGVHLPFDPGPHGVGLLGELAPEALVVLLFA